MIKRYLASVLSGLVLLVSSPEIGGCRTAKPSYVLGIDVSHHQERINWPMVHGKGYSFAYIKSTQGEDWQDPDYEKNLNGAKHAHMGVGCYHFATPGSWPYGRPYNLAADAKLEALDFVYRSERCLKPGNLRPALDLEDDGSGNIKKLSPQELADWVTVWMSIVEKRIGAKPILYGFRYPLKAGNADKKILEYDLWLADYTDPPNSEPWAKPLLWQYSRKGRVKGISGDIDLDRFDGTQREFNKTMLIR
jgi:lysozyme